MILLKLHLIIWKCWIIKKRHFILTIIETLSPIFLFLIAAYCRSKLSSLEKTNIEIPTYPDVKSADLLYTNYFPTNDLNLLYTPYTDLTEKLIRKVQLKFELRSDVIRKFDNEDELNKYYINHNNGTIVGVVFKGNPTIGAKSLNYELKFMSDFNIWKTDELFTHHNEYVSDIGSEAYFNKGFLALQTILDTSFIELSMNTTELPFSLLLKEFPYPPYKTDNGINEMFMYFLPLITIFSFIFLCPSVLKRIVEEKNSGIKELLKIVGMKSWMLWSGWILYALSTNIISIGFIVFLMKVPLCGSHYPPIEYCDFSILLVFLLLYSIASITFCFFISSLFDKPVHALAVGVLAWILSYFVPHTLITQYVGLTWNQKILFAIFPNIAVYYGYSAMSVYESREIGINWSNIFQPPSGGNADITMGNVFVMLFIEIIVFTILTMYIDEIKPGKYGIAKPVYYPISKIKNFIKQLFSKSSNNQISADLVALNNIEMVGDNQEIAIEIKRLTKKYGNNMAVHNLDLNIYKNQITVLLGENGAGKTTTMSIITGMIRPTSGSVIINGHNINCNMDEIRNIMGFCPQHDLFFPDMTVEEHLKFFSMLKGMSGKSAKDEIDELLKMLNLTEKRNDFAKNLSGGMKRKLCLAMAVVGNSKILILDEPTSGIDVESRRELWDLLLKWRNQKTIIISTHFMEEADALGDWISIMAKGNLQCYGTPMYLKSLYNTGYHISLILDSINYLIELKEVIQNIIPKANLITQDGNNCVFLLPTDDKSLITKTVIQLEMLNYISNISITQTSLEAVFLKTINGADSTDDCKQLTIPTYKNVTSDSVSKTKALLLKRFYFFINKPVIYFTSLLLTLIMLVLTLYLCQGSSNFYEGKSTVLDLNLNTYGDTTVYYGGDIFINNTLNDKLRNNYKKLIEKQQSKPIETESISNSIIENGINNIVFYKEHLIIGLELNKTYNNETFLTVMYSNKALHGAPISMNLLMNTIIKTLLNDDYNIHVKNSPFQQINSNSSPQEIKEFYVGILWFIMIPIGMLFLMGSFIVFPHAELSSNFTLLQYIIGVNPILYWLINFIFDFMLYLLMTIVIIFVIFLFGLLPNNDLFLGSSVLFTFWLILLVYGISMIPFTYLFSSKETAGGGFALMLMICMFIGIISASIVIALNESQSEYYINIGNILKHIFIILFPQFGLTYIGYKFSIKTVNNYNWYVMPKQKKFLICESDINRNPCCFGDSIECDIYKSYFKNTENSLLPDLYEMLLPFFIYMIMIVILKTNVFYFIYKKLKIFSNKQNSDMINKSSVNIHEGETLFNVSKLKKTFGNKNVLEDVTFNVDEKKCYGLLGVNGAGKTTTFRILTKDILQDCGDVYIKNNENKIQINDDEYSKNLGYCPQIDTLNFTLTGKQLLIITVMIRGLSRVDSIKVVEEFIELFGMEEYANKPCNTYSGGMKRKLNLALSLIGYQTVILLDEPTTGIDPASRRDIWNILSEIKKNKDLIFILTSHCMEECETLCDNIGIIKEGKIKAKGTISKLKEDYESGYMVMLKLSINKTLKSNKDKCINENEIKFNRSLSSSSSSSSSEEEKEIVIDIDCVDGVSIDDSSTNVEKIKTDFEKLFQNITLKDEHPALLHYLIKDPVCNRLSALFTKIDNFKKDHSIIEDFSVSRCSLEDVFLTVARSNNENE